MICIFCKKEYQTKYKYSKIYLEKRKYCSRQCFRDDVLNNPTIFKDGHKPLINQWGERNNQWKGDVAGYGALHKWVRDRKELKRCKICKATNKEKKLTWANKGHTYKRILRDYVSLCYKCHSDYDRGRVGLQ